MQDHFRLYRHRLPHWRESGATYFVTWRLHPLQPELTPAEREFIAGEFRHYDRRRYALRAYVVMNDHVHVLLEPIGEQRLEAIIHSLKSFTANRFQRHYGRNGGIWQDEYFDRIVRDEDEFQQKLGYILENPRKRWPGLVGYWWVWPQEKS
jgi:putative transposase